ncbi:MAG: hypothetical protein ACRC9O_03165 [Plesiomonas sp.]|uniref:hypothetical protein n=1 Tax=Plesiomonas sp. TaxID=2486279 RepID=UPI003F4131B5
MGLVINLEHWPVPAAITMATEGVTANYGGEFTSGGDSTADRKICKMLDKGKVLAAVDALPPHFSLWLLVAYAAPGYVSDAKAKELYEEVLGEFMSRCVISKWNMSEKRWEMFIKVIPLICYDIARNGCAGGITTREYSIALSSGTNISVSAIQKHFSRDWA